MPQKGKPLAHVTLGTEWVKQSGILTCQGLVHLAGLGHLDWQVWGTGERKEKRDKFNSTDQSLTKQRQFSSALLPPECQGPEYSNRD